MLVFAKKAAVEDLTAHNAARILHVDLDIEHGRIVIAVQYGTEVNGVFTPNKNVPVRMHVLDGNKSANILALPIVVQLLDAAEKRLLSLALESGVQA